MTATQEKPVEVPRDRWQRPLVVPPLGGKPVPYTRVTTVSRTLSDSFNLERWKLRKLLVGASQRKDLVLAAAEVMHTGGDDQDARLDEIVGKLTEAGLGRVAASVGTSLHQFAQWADQGQQTDYWPEDVVADIQAYRDALDEAGFVIEEIEKFVVLDAVEVAGTLDRIVRHTRTGRRYVLDIKTGKSIDYAAEWALQCSMYAHGQGYDPATHERTDLNVDTDHGLIAHVPVGSATCELYHLDLAKGWGDVTLALDVRRHQKNSAWQAYARPIRKKG